MSFTVPRNVPSFGDPHRILEDSTWGSARRPRHPENGFSSISAASEKIGDIFGGAKSKGLPMYKDKPYHYASSTRRAGLMFRKSSIAYVCLFLLGSWYLYSSFRYGSSRNVDTGGLWGILGKPESGTTADWESRREKVREAFKLSWASYETNAWGEFSQWVVRNFDKADLGDIRLRRVLSKLQAQATDGQKWNGMDYRRRTGYHDANESHE